MNSIDPDTTVGSVHLTIPDLNRSLKFYQEIVGLTVLQRNGKIARLGAGQNEIVVLKENPDARPARRATGLYHFAILVPSRLALARSLKRIADTETPVTGFADHLVSEALYLPDPDGNGIEIYRDRPRDEWRDPNGKLKMATDPLDMQGILAELQEQDETWRGMDTATRLGHMHLHVAEIAATEQFYVGTLGFDLIMRYGPSAAFVSAGGYHHHVGFNTWNGVGAPPPPPNSVGLDYFVVRVPNRAELGNAVDRVKRNGVAVEEVEEGLLVRDPSQNGVVLSAEDI